MTPDAAPQAPAATDRPDRPDPEDTATDEDEDGYEDGPRPWLTPRGRLLVLLGCVLVVLLTAWYSGTRFGPAVPQPSAGSVRLGPDPGEPVADYLARIPAELPPPGVSAPALVQLAEEVPSNEAADLIEGSAATAGGARVTTAVFRVPMTRVQTALRFTPVPAGRSVAEGLLAAREQARMLAETDLSRLDGRSRDIAAAEAVALADPACRCTSALVVQAGRAALEALAGTPGVRAVHAGPPGATTRELALSPLLPEQTERADPLPDDGPVPTS